MLDKTYLTLPRQSTQYVDRNTTIHEHRAPTDESIKILREMEAKARDNLILAVRVDDGPMPMAVQVVRGWDHEGVFVAMKLRISGKEQISRFKLDAFDMDQDLRKFADEVRDRALGALVAEFGPAILQALLSRAVRPDAQGMRSVSV